MQQHQAGRRLRLSRRRLLARPGARPPCSSRPSDADIEGTITNICRCGTYQQVREAIHMAAKA